MSDYPWEQMSLLPPPEITVEITVHAVGTQDTVQVGFETRSGFGGDLIGIEVMGFDRDSAGQQKLMQALYRYIWGLPDRTCPF